MVSNQPTTRRLLTLSGLALLLAFSPALFAKPRLMADAEMDQVCAKGSEGLTVDPVALSQMVFSFSRQTALGLISGNGSISVEVLPGASGRSQILLGPATTIPGNGQSSVRTAMARAAVAASAVPLDGIEIPPTNLQVVNGTVRIRGDVNINMQTLPAVLAALQQNRLVLPSGFNLGGAVQSLGGIR